MSRRPRVTTATAATSPELLVALGQFEALAGFRPAASSVELMRALAVTDLDPFVDLLSGQSDADGLRALFTTWITAPQPDLDVLVPAVIDGAIHYVRSGRRSSRPRPRPCSNSASATPAMPVCWPRCC